MIKINWIDSMRSDCTRKFEVILSKQHTVGEFIDSVLSERKGEWGYIGIYSEKNAFLGDPCCEYSDGKLKSNPLPNEISRKNKKGNRRWRVFSYGLYNYIGRIYG